MFEFFDGFEGLEVITVKVVGIVEYWWLFAVGGWDYGGVGGWCRLLGLLDVRGCLRLVVVGIVGGYWGW